MKTTRKSGFFHHLHSTKNTLLRVLNYIMMYGDAGEYCGVVLLDLSAAFDTVDHRILNHRLRQWVGTSYIPTSLMGVSHSLLVTSA